MVGNTDHMEESEVNALNSIFESSDRTEFKQEDTKEEAEDKAKKECPEPEEEETLGRPNRGPQGNWAKRKKKEEESLKEGMVKDWLDAKVQDALASIGDVAPEKKSAIEDAIYAAALAGKLGDGSPTSITATAITDMATELSGEVEAPVDEIEPDVETEDEPEAPPEMTKPEGDDMQDDEKDDEKKDEDEGDKLESIESAYELFGSSEGLHPGRNVFFSGDLGLDKGRVLDIMGGMAVVEDSKGGVRDVLLDKVAPLEECDKEIEMAIEGNVDEAIQSITDRTTKIQSESIRRKR